MLLAATTAASYLLYHLSDLIGKMHEITPLPPLDSRRSGYSPSDVYQLFTSLGDEGMALYKEGNWLDLVVFPLVLSSLLAMLMGRCLEGARFPVQYNLLPFVYAVADIAENCCIFWMLHTWPKFSPEVAGVCSLLTGFKWRFFYYSLGGVAIAGLLYARRLLFSQRPPAARPHLE